VANSPISSEPASASTARCHQRSAVRGADTAGAGG
jgi:hypothetical protein